MNDWNIQARAHACQACAKPFADKQRYHTLLFDLKHDVERQDLCESCWKADHEDTARHRQGFLSHWQGVYEAPPPPREVIQRENAESLLRKIIESNDSRCRYQLYPRRDARTQTAPQVKEQIQREGQRIFIYENSKPGTCSPFPTPASAQSARRGPA
jgi:hypothetical protein